MFPAEACQDPDWDMLACGGKKRPGEGASPAARRRRTSDISFLSVSDAISDAEDSDEDLPANPLRGQRRARATNDEDEEDDEGLELFGDEEEAEKPA